MRCRWCGKGISEGSWKSVFMALKWKQSFVFGAKRARLWYCACGCWANRENNFYCPLSVTCLSRTEKSEFRAQMTLGVAHLQHRDQRQPLCAREMCTIRDVSFFRPTLIYAAHNATHYWAVAAIGKWTEVLCYLLFFLNNRTALSWFFLLGKCQYTRDDWALWTSQNFSFFYQ